jgi:hypothetical protein
MKNLTQLTENLNEITSILNGIQKLKDQWLLTRAVIDCNEILIREENEKKEANLKKYSDTNDLKDSFIKLHESVITNLTSRKERAQKSRTKLFTIYQLMELETPYGQFFYNRKGWDAENKISLEDFSDKHAIIS